MADSSGTAIETIFPDGEATLVATQSGNWTDAATWDGSNTPAATTYNKIHIPSGITVTYNSTSTDELVWIKVDGVLSFATNMTTNLEVETLLIMDEGELRIGTAGSPLSSAYTATITFTGETGDIDVADDTMFISRGLVSWGIINVYGAEKSPFHRISSIGDTSPTQVVLEEVPTGWAVGDTIVITGTHFLGNSAGSWLGTEDEERAITSFGGTNATINWSGGLSHDHNGPETRFKGHVANITRNIVFQTQNGASIAANRRAHAMFHDYRTNLHHCKFFAMGRTNKNASSDTLTNLSPITSSSNIQGRYACHFHEVAYNASGTPLVKGSVCQDTVGWNFVHHDSHLEIEDCVSYDFVGTGFVSETGAESGHWRHNIAIKGKGKDAIGANRTSNAISGDFKDSGDVNTTVAAGGGDPAPDQGRTGTGFWFQGRGLENKHNVAAGCMAGFAYIHRPDLFGFTPKEAIDIADFGNHAYTGAQADHVPITDAVNGEAFACALGFIVIKANPNQRHPGRTHFEDFKLWEVYEGLHLEYTSHYSVKNFDIYASATANDRGTRFGPNTTDMTFIDITVTNFSRGFCFGKGVPTYDSNPTPPGSANALYPAGGFNHVLINHSAVNCGTDIVYDDGTADIMITDAGTVHDTLILDTADVDQNTPLYLTNLAVSTPNWNVTAERPWSYGNGILKDSISAEAFAAGTEARGADPEYGYGLSWVNSPDTDQDNGIGGFVSRWGYFTNLGAYVVAFPVWAADRFNSDMYIMQTAFTYFSSDFGLHTRTTGGTPWPNNGAYDHVNSPVSGPTIPNQTVSSIDGAAVVINPFTGVTHPNGDSMYIYAIQQPKYGKVVNNGDNTCTFTPDSIYQPDPVYFNLFTVDDHGNYNNVRIHVRCLTTGTNYRKASTALGVGF